MIAIKSSDTIFPQLEPFKWIVVGMLSVCTSDCFCNITQDDFPDPKTPFALIETLHWLKWCQNWLYID